MEPSLREFDGVYSYGEEPNRPVAAFRVERATTEFNISDFEAPLAPTIAPLTPPAAVVATASGSGSASDKDKEQKDKEKEPSSLQAVLVPSPSQSLYPDGRVEAGAWMELEPAFPGTDRFASASTGFNQFFFIYGGVVSTCPVLS